MKPCANCGNAKVKVSDYGAFATVRCKCGRTCGNKGSVALAEQAWNEMNAAAEAHPAQVTCKGEEFFNWFERERNREVIIFMMEATKVHGVWRLYLRWPAATQGELY